MTKTVEKENNTLRNVVAGAAVVGAGILAAKVLTDENTRENIKDAMGKVEKKGEEVLTTLNNSKDDVVKNVIREFEYLKLKIERSKGAKDLQKEVNAIEAIIKEIQKSNQEDMEKLVKQIQSSVEKLKKDFEGEQTSVKAKA
jgi:endonuclease III-like uncharacterized protein